MKTKLQLLITLTVLACFSFIGCEKEQILMSSSKVEGKLQSTWQKVDLSSSSSNVTSAINWKFNEGKVYLIKNETVLASGNYKIDASVTKVNIITSDFPEPGYDYMNGKWQVITLNDDILVMADTYTGGTLEVEFTKQK